MTIAVLGAGALGSLLGAHLAQVDDVVLISRNAAYLAAVRARGLRLIAGGVERRFDLPVSPPDEASGPMDLVLVATKAYDTAAAAPTAARLVAPDGLVVTVQNGIGNYETLSAACGIGRVAVGVTAHGALMEQPGVVHHTGVGQTLFAAVPSLRPRLDIVAAMFERAGLPAAVGDDVDGLLWSKLLVNVGINALTALLRVRNGVLADVEPARRLMLAAVAEATTVARARGTRLPPGDPQERVLAVARATAANQSSMLRDVLRRRRTEVAAINGAVVREGERLGIPTPINAALLALIESVEAVQAQRIGDAEPTALRH